MKNQFLLVFIVFSVALDVFAADEASSPNPKNKQGKDRKKNHASGSGGKSSGSGPVSSPPGGGAAGYGRSDGYFSDWNSRDWGVLGNPNPGKCVDIPANLTLCRDIGYEQMRLPNLLEHDTLKEVSQQASSWVRLLGVRCHADTQIFLCSLFAPVCLDRPIWPCRSLCEAVKTGCEDRMLKYGFPWPEMLRCDQYPTGDDLCIGLRNENSTGKDASCSVCQYGTLESAVDHFCQSNFVMRVKIKQSIVTGSDLKIDIEKKKKIFKTGSLKSGDLKDASLYIANGSSCDCSSLDGGAGGGTGGGKNASSYIVMGNVVDGRLLLSFVHRITPKSEEVTRAMKVARHPEVCMKPESAVEKKKASAPTAVATPTQQRKGSGTQHRKSKVKHPGKGNRKSKEWKLTTTKGKTTTPASTDAVKQTPAAADRMKKGGMKKKSSATQLFY